MLCFVLYQPFSDLAKFTLTILNLYFSNWSHYTFVGLRHTTPFSPIARVRPVLLWHPVAFHMAQRETSRRTSVLNGSPGLPGSPPWRSWHALMN